MTVTSYQRSFEAEPAPTELVPAPPEGDETPNLLLGGGVGPVSPGEAESMYWWVETITSRELLERTFPGRISACGSRLAAANAR